ncbi:hypothetical protein [Muriicola soli]|uniref:DUF4468 domain-containing protein n=1 Tax=Muriicola soli TaxID=2507538 RepID=A0A411EAN6_9FLAO|nr:hypothetical protein [Muriicola soli]QBA64791.1 hypothetical protein EQY75_09790 [Muriicola soli]
MKKVLVLILFLLSVIGLTAQNTLYSDTVYIDSYKMPRQITPDDLVDEIKTFLITRDYEIVEESPIETNGRQDSFEKNEASWLARTFLGRKVLKEYPFSIKHTLTFDQNKNGRNYVIIFSLASLDQKNLSEEILEDIQEQAMKSAENIAKDEFRELKKLVKEKGSGGSQN